MKGVGSAEVWAQSLDKLLGDRAGLKCFHEFLKKEFSEENLLFWIACERFRNLKDTSQLAASSRKIYTNYLSKDAAFLVNIDSNALKKTECELNTPHLAMFNVPQQHVFQLMKFDSYNRFLKSPTYHNYIAAEKSGRRLNDVENNNNAFRKNQMATKSMRSPTTTSGVVGDKKKNPLNFLHRGKPPAVPLAAHLGNHDPLRKVRSSSLGAYDECNRKNIVSGSVVPETNGSNMLCSIDASDNNDHLWNGGGSRSKIVRVVLPDGTSGFIVGETGKSLRDGLKDLVESKNLMLQMVDVSIGSEKKPAANLDCDISCLEESIVYLERRVLLRFDLPNGRSVGLKSSPNKSLRDVVFPVMKANSFELEEYSIVLINTKIPLSLDMSISTLENKRIVAKSLHRALDKQNSDPVGSRQRAQGFHASFRKYRNNDRFPQQDPNHDKLPNKRSDEAASALMHVLQKCQSSRMDDQRGMLPRNIELPDFLKVTSSTPAPIRSKPIATNKVNLSVSSNPLPCAVSQFPGSPFFINKSFKDLTDQLDLSLSSSLDNPARGTSLDGSRDDCSFESGYSVSTFPRPTVTKVKLVGLSKSDSLLTRDNLITVSQSSTADGGSSFGTPRDISVGDMVDDVFISNTGSLSYGDNYVNEAYNADNEETTCNNTNIDNQKDNDDGETNYRYLANERGRPLPITNFNESEIMRGLKSDDREELNGVNAAEDGTTRGRMIRDSGIGTHPTNSGNNLHLITAGDTCDTTSNSMQRKQKPPDLKLALLSVPSQSTEQLGCLDIIDYNLSPRALGRFRKFSLEDEPEDVAEAENSENVRFEVNAVPTPQKDQLLSGETVRGRQNEKITFV